MGCSARPQISAKTIELKTQASPQRESAKIAGKLLLHYEWKNKDWVLSEIENISFVKHNREAKADRYRTTATRGSIQAISTAIEVYRMDTGELPASLNDLIDNPGIADWDGPYLKCKTDDLVDAWGNHLHYTKNGFSFFSYISRSRWGSRNC
jgi:hypothetical protein